MHRIYQGEKTDEFSQIFPNTKFQIPKIVTACLKYTSKKLIENFGECPGKMGYSHSGL
jgi:hypothetical protein